MYRLFSHRFFKSVAVFLVTNIITQLLYPLKSFALTSGPSQPEVQSFEPVGTTEMVDLFSGDFTYNIPLFELQGPNGGYPFSLHYNAGVTMDQEASWVGLGWNLNPGALNRQMRGLPDEFKADTIKREQDIKTNTTFGVGFGGNFEVFGADASDGEEATPQLTLGFGVYYNTYKGVGYNIDAGLSVQSASKDGLNGGLGFNFSLDSQEGVGINPSLSLTSKQDQNVTDFNIGVGYNSRRGLTTISSGITSKDKITVKDKSYKVTRGGSSTFSYAAPAYSPQVSMPMQGRHVSLTFKTGGAIFGVYGDLYVNGFFNTQYLGQKSTTALGYGYMYMDSARTGDVLDFNREKDGMVRKNMPNLPSPVMTNDIYSVAGQGIGGMYRPFRNDVGTLYDQAMTSVTAGGAGGADAGLGMPHIGANLTINYATTSSGKWTDGNLMASTYSFTKQSNGNLYEPYYFKSYGEHTSDTLAELDYIGKTDAVKVKLSGTALSATAGNTLINNQKTEIAGVNKNSLEAREPRNSPVLPVTNSDLLDKSGKEVLREYRIRYYDKVSSNEYRNPLDTTRSYKRTNYRGNHTAGFTAVNPDGSRYIYGLPAYNTKQVECQFSVSPPTNRCSPVITIDKASLDADKPNYKVSNSEQYYNRTTLPKYAHSFLLTAVVGPDYIDADSVDGPSVGDLGYWVKFNYVKVNSAYQWRVPFDGAHYNRGSTSTPFDDKASYTYGVKEMWHLATAETRSNIAVFNISKRQDGAGVVRELQNTIDGTRFGGISYQLDSISLYSRSEYTQTTHAPVATQKVHFSYTYDLCPNVPNNMGDQSVAGNAKKGKLTLKNVWFTYENSNRGVLSPYVFNYNEGNSAENPSYNTHQYDRWGNFKPETDLCNGVNNPYVKQFDRNDASFKTNLDRNMAVWNLKSIQLPSGGTIDIKYEADDYGYVQNKTAMQMMPIVSLDAAGASHRDTSNAINHPSDAPGSKRRVYFNLEYPVSKDSTYAYGRNEVSKYLDGTGKVYFKVFSNLRSPVDTFFRDYVSGYADVEYWSVDSTSLNTENTQYTRGYVQLGKLKFAGKTMHYHPFSMAAWQYLRTNQPSLLNAGSYKNDPNTGEGQKEAKVKGLLDIFSDVKKLFEGYNTYCFNQNFANRIILSKSFIRLNSPDKIKYGGGVRVKEIVLKDGWTGMSSEPESVYGQTYEYTIVENKQTISSGVASYEPLIGGEEIALRYAKGFSEEIPLQTPNNLFFELPVNESYYPGPMIGYRKVTVKSLATKYEQVTGTSDPYNIPSGIMTTGATVHEFYTAKEFPVITKETVISTLPYDMYIPIPFLGQITYNNLTASQGYTIELNDMHGKPKQVTNYKQDAQGNLVDEPVSWIRYNYQSNPILNPGSDRTKDYYVLDNKVPVLISDKNGVVTKSNRFVGQDYEFFTDMRESRTESTSGGVRVNLDLVTTPFPIPALAPWPSVGSSTTIARTAVTNKIIHRSGILISTEAYNAGSLARTTNKLFDAITGDPVLISITNDYEDNVYSYSVPAHNVYDGIGPAYKNLGFRFTGTLTSGTATNTYKVSNTGSSWKQQLVFGDEFIVRDTVTNIARKGIYVDNDGSNMIFYIEDPSFAGKRNFVLIRSGRRNQLNASVEHIGALTDPTINRTAFVCNIPTTIPKICKVNKTVSVPSNCAVGQIGGLNVLLKPSPPVCTSIPFPCTDPNSWSSVMPDNYLKIGGPGKIIIINTSDCSSNTAASYAILYDANGSLIDFTKVDSVNNLQIVSSYPSAISTTETFKNRSVDVYYKNGGGTVKAYIFGPMFWNFDPKTITADSICLVDTTVSATKYKINNVLSISATRLSDNWGMDNTILRDNNLLSGSPYWTPAKRAIFANKNAYANGTEGIWRSWEEYSYVDMRKQSAAVNTRTDGTFDNVPLFDFVYPNQFGCAPYWRKINTITDYNPYASASEDKDIEGIYSAALFGYSGGDLLTGRASNARNSEIAFESFEEFQPGGSVTMSNYGTGNLFVPTTTTTSAMNLYVSFSVTSGNNNLIVIDKPYNLNSKTVTAEVDGLVYFPLSLAGTKIHGKYNVTLEEANPSDPSVTLLQLDASKFPYSNVKWTGKVKCQIQTPQTNPYVYLGNGTSISSFTAHSGKNSLKTTGGYSVEQRKLQLVPGKKYVFSSWVKLASPSYTYGVQGTYQGASVVLYFKDINGAFISGQASIVPSGSVINTWQKLEGTFVVPSNASTLVVTFSNGDASAVAYYDDVRIHPSTAEMETYVYSNTDYKLKVTLDNNNYATYYHYDAEGNLFLIKKETEKGLQTIQEVIGHKKEN